VNSSNIICWRTTISLCRNHFENICPNCSIEERVAHILTLMTKFGLKLMTVGSHHRSLTRQWKVQFCSIFGRRGLRLFLKIYFTIRNRNHNLIFIWLQISFSRLGLVCKEFMNSLNRTRLHKVTSRFPQSLPPCVSGPRKVLYEKLTSGKKFQAVCPDPPNYYSIRKDLQRLRKSYLSSLHTIKNWMLKGSA